MQGYTCKVCKCEDNLRVEGGTLFCLRCGNKVGKVEKAAKRSVDKATLFSEAWKLYAPSNAPKMTAEYRFDPERKYRFDFAFKRKKLAVEINGGRWAVGGGRHASDADYEKMRNAAILGWRVMPFSPGELKRDPIRCVNEVLRALGIEVQA